MDKECEAHLGLTLETDEALRHFAPVGHYLALRIGFAFPMVEVNALPTLWVEHYTKQRFLLADPVLRWSYAQTGTARWSDFEQSEDKLGVLAQARVFGLRYGLVVACMDRDNTGQRSFGSFVRGDREFSDEEAAVALAYVLRRHRELTPPTNLTRAEIEALRMVREGKRLKQIAFELGVTEGAVKQRLRNAKLKLNAATSPQAAAMASEFGII